MIFPLKDSIPRMHRPWAVWTLIALTILVFWWQRSLPPAGFALSVNIFGLVPQQFSAWLFADTAGPVFPPVTLVSYMFLHGGWWHLISNVWICWIFADNIEDVMGPFRFTLFYLCCGVIAALAHLAANMHSPIPVVGASGAISGVLGAYFLLYPHARVLTFVVFLILDLPAALYLGGWFLLQLYSGLTASPGSGGIAWWAHLGGFVAGMLLVPLFRNCRPCPPILPEFRPPRPKPDPKDPWAHLRSKGPE